MKFRLLLCFAALAAIAGAQTQAPAPSSPASRVPPAKRSNTPAKTAKKVLPDPDLLDGSALEPEKRPVYGMLAEIEMGEKEGGMSAQVSPESGGAGGSQQSADRRSGAGSRGADQSKAEQGTGAGEKVPEGPAAPPEGVQAKNLEVPEGSAQAVGAGLDSSKPRDLQIGDATLQIQTLGKNTPNVVGLEGTSSQQYEKKLPAGQQSNNRNQGVEKGQVVPKGL